MSNVEFPTFYQIAKTGIKVDTPELNVDGFEAFINFMKSKGWIFTEKLHNDYELSTTYNVDNSINREYSHEEWNNDLCEYQYSNIPSLIINLYKEKGFVSKDNHPLPLCDYCSYSNECFIGNEDRKPNIANHQWSLIEKPWIGKNYSKGKVAFLGINPNEDGGLNEIYTLIDSARSEMKEGKTKVDFGYVYPDGRKYDGTYLWHRIAAYSKAINGALSIDNNDLFGQINFLNEDTFLPKVVSDEFDNIAFLNHIKCSPIGDRSKPTNKMWEKCGKHILIEELRILRPKWLIVLGSGDNMWALNKNVLNSEQVFNKEELKYCKTKVFGIETTIIAVPHPSSLRGGANKKYYQYLFDLVQMLKKH